MDADHLSSLKIGDGITYLSGFNVWVNLQNPTPIASGESNIRHYIVTDSAYTMLSVLATAATASVLASF